MSDKFMTLDSTFKSKSSRGRESPFGNQLAEYTKMKESKGNLQTLLDNQPVYELLTSYDKKVMDGLEFSKKKKQLNAYKQINA